MTKLRFDYYMQIDYTEEVSNCHFTIKCIPVSNVRQKIENIKIELSPDVPYNYGNDGFHNRQIYGANDIPHKTFSFHITGDAVTGMNEYEECEDENLTMIFRHPYGLNRPGSNILKYYETLKEEICRENTPPCNNLSLAGKIMHLLHNDYKYKAGVTDVKTGAEEAFTLGYGVCQDYAHIFISLLHLFGIPARYVTGLIIGEGASHAWVEVMQDGKWYGFDPTNDKTVSDEHIKIGVGRDAGDCMINRGIMHGGGYHTQDIKVSVIKES